MTTRFARIAGAAAGLAVIGALAASPAGAAAGYDVTVAGQRQFTPLMNLASSSRQVIDVVNLPSGVGLYALHCKVPDDPRSQPTLCDLSTEAFGYLTASNAERASASMTIKVNGEFYGMDPNPTSGSSPSASVDCRESTGDPRATACAVYILGAGKDSANPAYLRVFPTVFLPVKAARAADRARIELDGKLVRRGTKPRLAADTTVPLAVSLKSGLTASLSSDNCRVDVTRGTITALKSAGTCTLLMTSTGGRNYEPLVSRQVFRLTP
jgi:hypothetical protein